MALPADLTLPSSLLHLPLLCHKGWTPSCLSFRGDHRGQNLPAQPLTSIILIIHSKSWGPVMGGGRRKNPSFFSPSHRSLAVTPTLCISLFNPHPWWPKLADPDGQRRSGMCHLSWTVLSCAKPQGWSRVEAAQGRAGQQAVLSVPLAQVCAAAPAPGPGPADADADAYAYADAAASCCWGCWACCSGQHSC